MYCKLSKYHSTALSRNSAFDENCFVDNASKSSCILNIAEVHPCLNFFATLYHKQVSREG